MDVETRLSAEWQANNELLKFYEDLKQKRFAQFLTIQTAFLAFFAVLAKDALASISMVSLTALVLIAIPPLIISHYFLRVDAHTRALVDIATTRLLLVETDWKALSPANHFSTYQQQFAIVSRHDEQTIEQYVGIRQTESDQFRPLMLAKSAHVSETTILRMFWWLWVVLAGMAAIIHLIWHLVNGFSAMKMS